jgi:hypothetical protein
MKTKGNKIWSVKIALQLNKKFETSNENCTVTLIRPQLCMTFECMGKQYGCIQAVWLLAIAAQFLFLYPEQYRKLTAAIIVQ